MLKLTYMEKPAVTNAITRNAAITGIISDVAEDNTDSY